MKRAKPETKKLGAPFWMVTFSDMVTLLMVFFIMILSYSTIELEKFKGAVSSMKGALGILDNMKSSINNKMRRSNEGSKYFKDQVEKKIEKIKKLLEMSHIKDQIDIEMDGMGIHIRLGDNILFDQGKADLKPSSFPILKAVADVARDDFKEIYVEGHTDNVPIHTEKYPTNWELSTDRALSVVRYFHYVEGISASRLAAVGYGEYRPLVPNTTPKNRAKNRRVEIYIRFDER
ncbi:MAG: OmpA family protein [Calditrichaeota bacterium]|nr:OmpA family protein [Calditrichota bacterium]